MTNHIEKRLAELTQELANAYIRKAQAEEAIKRIEAAYTEVQNLKEHSVPKPPENRPGPPPYARNSDEPKQEAGE